MSDPAELSPDLAEMEQRLTFQAAADPSAELRPRVMARVRHELLRGAGPGAWQFAAAIVSAALVGANLIMATTQSVAETPRQSIASHRRIEATAEQLRSCLTEMTEEDALRHALLLDARSRIVAAPRAHRPVALVATEATLPSKRH